jgi:hypothetical protein
MNEYSFGFCPHCHKYKALKNGTCAECEYINMPDFIKDLFKNKGDDNVKN